MRALLFVCLCSIVMIAEAQLPNFKIQSEKKYYFSINAKDATQYLKLNKIDFDYFLNQEPKHIFNYTSNPLDSLTNGIYLEVWLENFNIWAKVVNKTNLFTSVTEQNKGFIIQIRDENGYTINNSHLIHGNESIKYQAELAGYEIKKQKKEHGYYLAIAGNDTALVEVTRNKNYREINLRKSWRSFKYSKVGRIVTWAPLQIVGIFNPRHKPKSFKKRTYYTGYALFNQPKYKPGDTVKWKAFVVDNKGNTLKKELTATLSYYKYGYYKQQNIGTVEAATPGAYFGEFVLSDTLPNDTKYNFDLYNDKGRSVVGNKFKIESYKLNETTDYGLKTDKDTYYKDDSIHITVHAKDANGLPIMDGKVRLIVKPNNITYITDSYDSIVYIQDTIASANLTLDKTGETKYSFHSNIIGKANFSLNIKAYFTNSNNETVTKDNTIQYFYEKTALVCKKVNDSLEIKYLVNNKEINVTGKYYTEQGTKQILFPAKIKINPLITHYIFEYTNPSTKKKYETEYYQPRYSSNIEFKRISNKTTGGFILLNPQKEPIVWTLFKNKRVYESGSFDSSRFEWTKQMTANESYTLEYKCANNQSSSFTETIRLITHKLDVAVSTKEKVNPGQKEEITIKVTDYKNDAVENVNLTAAAYNSQFSDEISIPRLPNIKTYRSKKLKRQKFHFSKKTDALIWSTKIAEHKNWITKMKEQNNMYFSLLAVDSVVNRKIMTADSITQLSVVLIDRGQAINPNMLYINNRLVYYNETSLPVPYSFAVTPGFHQVRIRIPGKTIILKDLAVFEYMKNDYYINIGNIPASIGYTIDEKYLMSESEKETINSTCIAIQPYKNRAGTYLKQHDKVFYLSDNMDTKILGPWLPFQNIIHYKKYEFLTSFEMEPGYQYQLHFNKTRLEKKPVLYPNVKYYFYPKWFPYLPLRDSVLSLPEIELSDIRQKTPRIEEKFFIAQADAASGHLKIIDTEGKRIAGVYMTPLDSSLNSISWPIKTSRKDIAAGFYNITLISKDGYFASYKNVAIKNSTTCIINIDSSKWSRDNADFTTIFNTGEVISKNQNFRKEDYPNITKNSNESGQKIQYTGKVLSNNLMGIPFAHIKIEGTNTGAAANENGVFTINAKSGDILVVSSVGYETTRVKLNDDYRLNIQLQPSLNKYEEYNVISATDGHRNLKSLLGAESVVVVGYGSQRKKNSLQTNLDYEDDFNPNKVLMGKVAGVMVSGNNSIRIRGKKSITDREDLLYVVDGVLTNNPNLDADEIESMDMLKETSATALYGSRAANGVVIITTKKAGNTIRQLFKDYAIWQPNLITNKNGEAKFEAQYPDNITSWSLHVLAMDNKKRTGSTAKNIVSYKPLLAQLSLPQFLLVGDSAELVGKAINYTDDSYNTQLLWNNKVITTIALQPKATSVNKLSIQPNTIGLNTYQFGLKTTSNFEDAEQRKIPVLPVGTTEVKGIFKVMNVDSVINFVSTNKNNIITVSALNNTFDLLLSEIDNVKKYGYYCMEQTASKLMVLQMEKDIRKALGQQFEYEKEKRKLIDRLLKNQNYNGGWGWWDGNSYNEAVTLHVLSALANTDKNAVIENAISNGAILLHSSLATNDQNSKVNKLHLLKTLGYSKLIYKLYYDKINFDSLDMIAKWKFIDILQMDSANYKSYYAKMMKARQETMLGGSFWYGNDEYLWHSDNTAATTLAYKVIKQQNPNDSLLPSIRQYFMETKRNGYWPNTYNAAIILKTILPDLLHEVNQKNSPILQITGDTSFSINSYPASITMQQKDKLSIAQKGKGQLYVTAYETFYNSTPASVAKDIIVQTNLLQQGKPVKQLISGINTTIVLDVECKKEANYVMIELPIPAGCIYDAKKQDYRIVHTEFFNDKVVMFVEQLKVGKHNFSFDLQTRYNGNYTINPAKVSLMYFPTFYGREALKKVKIQGE